MYTQFGNIFTFMGTWLYSLIGNQTKCGGFIRCNIFLEWSYFISVKLFDDNIDETVMKQKYLLWWKWCQTWETVVLININCLHIIHIEMDFILL